MKVLINYTMEEKSYLNAMDWLLKRNGHEGVATARTLTMTEINQIAQTMGCGGVLVGNAQTLKNLVGGDKPTLDKWRGTRVDLNVPCIVINSLTHFHSVNHGQWLFQKDIDKLKYAKKRRTPFTYSVLKDPSQFAKWVDLAEKALLIGCDIETNQHSMKKNAKSSTRVSCFDPSTYDIAGLGETWITCLGFSMVMPDLSIETCVLPLVEGEEDFWLTDTNYALALQFMQDMLHTDTPKCFHNGLYDCFHLLRYNAWPRNWTLDTMGLSHSWYSELPKTLDFLGSWLLYDYYYWKDEADSTHKAKDYNSYYQYNAKDCWVMVRCLIQLLLIGEDWMFTNYPPAFRLVYPSLYGAFEGLRVNNETRAKLLKGAMIKKEEELETIRIMTDDPEFNPGSPKQVEHFIYEVLGARRPPRSKSKGATDKKSRVYVSGQHPLIAMFTDRLDVYNKEAKAISTYYTFLLWRSRLMYSLDPFGTETGRFASRASAGWCGTQIQNQPSYAKYMYEPDPGFIGLEFDYSKAEAVCTAHLAEAEALIEALADKSVDFYKRLGNLFFQMKVEDVTDDFRNKVCKKIQHGTNYMMGADTFIDNTGASILMFAAGILNITIVDMKSTRDDEMTMQQFAQFLLDSYHNPFPEVRKWWEAIRNEVATTSKLVSPTGHVRYFFGDPMKNHKVFRSAVAHQPQNLSVTKLNEGMWKVYELMKKYPGIIRLKTQIHDSVKAQIRIDKARELVPLIQDTITARHMVKGRMMVIEVDAEAYSTCWKDKIKWSVFAQEQLPALEAEYARLTAQ